MPRPSSIPKLSESWANATSFTRRERNGVTRGAPRRRGGRGVLPGPGRSRRRRAWGLQPAAAARAAGAGRRDDALGAGRRDDAAELSRNFGEVRAATAADDSSGRRGDHRGDRIVRPAAAPADAAARHGVRLRQLLRRGQGLRLHPAVARRRARLPPRQLLSGRGPRPPRSAESRKSRSSAGRRENTPATSTRPSRTCASKLV